MKKISPSLCIDSSRRGLNGLVPKYSGILRKSSFNKHTHPFHPFSLHIADRRMGYKNSMKAVTLPPRLHLTLKPCGQVRFVYRFLLSLWRVISFFSLTLSLKHDFYLVPLPITTLTTWTCFPFNMTSKHSLAHLNPSLCHSNLPQTTARKFHKPPGILLASKRWSRGKMSPLFICLLRLSHD